ncbi:MAG: GIY-YIG nuclease family protein [Chitinophagaceae bacterium]|nr:GIY-YIG nuclease family protein [Chitinophagaceae bacterium]
MYILYSPSADRYYVGISQNPFQLLEQHNHSERVTYTRKYRPWKMAALFICGQTLSEARRVERFIKAKKSRRLIESLTDPSTVLKDELAQLVRVPFERD